MTEELSYAMQYLTAEGYVIRLPQDLFVFTNKFYLEFTGNDIGAIPVAEIAMIKSSSAVISLSTKTEDVKRDYLAFISACKIPARTENSQGDVYNLNQYSEKGMKAFGKILRRVAKGEINMDLLIKTTQLYYKSPAYKLKIGNFIGDGAWETHYNEMLESIEKKTLTDHIQSTLEHDTTGTSRYRLGTKSDPESAPSDSRRTLGPKFRAPTLQQKNQ